MSEGKSILRRSHRSHISSRSAKHLGRRNKTRNKVSESLYRQVQRLEKKYAVKFAK